ncbi:lipoprotein LpqH [Mycobacterium sp. 94-17]|uniref:lipoprotein LpqH n=1 Tax=Mycobacterium sp. 94-17 TaxID=2986147 RepID=UPI002D1EFF2D|nr:lipoprotein LpqH [Mycobacterium sp. 94-17]MEB4211416.1 lipoprotein LpqH [Mycobacterium sp. 94-17]
MADLDNRQWVVRAATVAFALALAACSSNAGHPAAPSSSTPPLASTTVMIDGNRHAIIAAVDCSRSAAQPNASPPESGDLTTRINVHDDSASVSLAVSDEQPPSVDGFALSLKLGDDRYQLPYQGTKSPTQAQATKDGKSYTVTGTGQATAPGQSGLRDVTFGIHVTCP